MPTKNVKITAFSSESVDLMETKQNQNKIHTQVFGNAKYNTCAKFQGKILNPSLVETAEIFRFLNKRYDFW